MIIPLAITHLSTQTLPSPFPAFFAFSYLAPWCYYAAQEFTAIHKGDSVRAESLRERVRNQGRQQEGPRGGRDGPAAAPDGGGGADDDVSCGADRRDDIDRETVEPSAALAAILENVPTK